MRLAVFFALIVLVAGCADSRMAVDPWKAVPGRPAPPPELGQLERLVGAWSVTAEMISPSPEEMNAMLPEGESMPGSFSGGGAWEPFLGGLFLRWEGWHEIPGGERMRYVEIMTWDPKARVFRSWYFDDWGEFGEGTLKPSVDGRFFHTTNRGRDTTGGSSRGRGSMEFVNDDLIQWRYRGSGPQGVTEFTGTSRRDQPDP